VKKKVMSLLLCLVMLVPAFAMVGCGDSTYEESSMMTPRTIVIAAITDEKTTPEAIKLVEKELNSITKSEFNANVVLKLYTQDEYVEMVMEQLDNMKAKVDEGGNAWDSDGEEDDDEVVVTTVNKYGRVETVYPSVFENQIDIVMVLGPDQLTEMIKQEHVIELDSYIKNDSKLITKYINQSLLNAGRGVVTWSVDDITEEDVITVALGQSGGTLYGIPSNSPLGNYEYMLIRKDLFDKYSYDIDNVKDLLSPDMKSFLIDVAKKESDVIPLYNITDMSMLSVNGDRSVVGEYVTDTSSILENPFTPINILSSKHVRETLTLVNSIKENGGQVPLCTTDVDFNKNFAVAYLNGTPEIEELYEEDYYIINNKVPRAGNDQLYYGMYCISAYSKDPDRCAKIITALSTNKTFRNTYYYGVENTHYVFDEDTGYVSRISDDYTMSMYTTGNVMLTWQNDEMDADMLKLSANNWEYAKEMNRNSINSPYLGFEVKDMYTSNDPYTMDGIMTALDLIYDEMWTKIWEYDTYVDAETGEKVEFEEYLDYLMKWLNSVPEVNAALSLGSRKSLRTQFVTWYDSIYVKDEV